MNKELFARRLAIFAAGFSLIVCILLIVNYVQSKAVNPIESETLKTLVDRLKQNPPDEQLVNEIRAFDLLARKAYFTSQWQLRTGGYLLILGLITTILSVRYVRASRSKLDELEGIEKDAHLDSLLARKWVIIAGAGIIVLAIVSGALSYNALDAYTVPESSTAENSAVSVSEAPAPTEPVASAAQSSDTSSVQSATVTETQTPVTEEEKTSVAAPVAVAPKAAAIPSLKELQANYPYFRGAEGRGVAYQNNVPTSWDGVAGTQVLWKVKTPKHGFSSPIIWKNKVFMTGADKSAREVYCYDLASGKLLWTAKAEQIPGSPAQMPKVTEDTGFAAPTMATNGSAVFAIFANGDLLSLDMDGKQLWSKNMGVPDNHYGHSSSLIIYKDKLIIQYDTNKGGKVMALSTATGDEVWLTPRKSKISWSSPILVNTGGRTELILTTDPNVDSYDPETGKELWSVKCLSGEVGASAGYDNGMVFAANEYAIFAAIKLGAKPEIVWQADEFLPEVASPLAVNGLVVIATSYGAVACYDTASGDKLWSQEFSSGFYASPVYAGGNFYLMDMSGVCHVVKTAKEYQLVGESKLGEKCVCSPVFADGKLLIRGFDNLYCIGK